MDRPVSVAVKGPSSGGKSFVVESTLKFFPSEAFYALTAMSDRALAYSSEPLKHRLLVIYEAAGMASDFATYLIRSLLSEGRLRYETVEKTKEGLVPRLIPRTIKRIGREQFVDPPHEYEIVVVGRPFLSVYARARRFRDRG